jgi:hypothetical protein
MAEKMGSGDEENQTDLNSEEDIVEQAKQLLELTNLVEKYPSVIVRRVTGLTYVLVGGGIAFMVLLFMSITEFVGYVGDTVFLVAAFVGISLLIAWAIPFRLIVPLTKTYPTPEGTSEGMSVFLKATWALMAILMIISSMVTFGIGQPNLFPVIVQLSMTLGNVANYYEGSRGPQTEPFAREHLVFAGLVLFSVIPMLLLPIIAYPTLILVDVGGIYMLGVYMLITAEKLLLESSGRS